MQFFLFLALILALAVVSFAVQNSAVITLTFIKWSFEGSLAFVLALAFTVGTVTGVFISIPTLWRKAKENRAQRKRVQELERELSNLEEQNGISEPDVEEE